MTIRTVNKHKGVDISCPRAVMNDFDLIYFRTKGYMNGFDPLIAFVRHRDPSWRNLSLRKNTACSIPYIGHFDFFSLSYIRDTLFNSVYCLWVFGFNYQCSANIEFHSCKQ